MNARKALQAQVWPSYFRNETIADRGMMTRFSIRRLLAMASAPLAVCAAEAAAGQELPPEPSAPFVSGAIAEQSADALEAYAKGHDALSAKREELAIRMFRAGCERREPRSCFNVAKISEQKLDARPASHSPDSSLVATITKGYSAACDLGFQRGCANLVRYLRSPDYGLQDYAKAGEIARAACDAGEALACGDLAEMHYRGEGMAVDLSKAAELFEQACEADGPAASCFNFGLMLAKGQAQGVKAREFPFYYREGCRRGSNEACINLAVEYASAPDVPDNLDMASGLLEQACTRGSTVACTNLAVLTLDHRLGAEPPATAAALYRKACEAGDGAACRGLGNLAQEGVKQAGTPREAIALFQKGCELGSGPSCYNAGLMYLIGYETAEQPLLGLHWFARGCSLGSAASCAGAAMASHAPKPTHPNLGVDASRRWLAQARALNPTDPIVLSLDAWLPDEGTDELAPPAPPPPLPQLR